MLFAKVRKVRGNTVDPIDGGDVHMYRDSSVAPLLILRRCLKVVYDVIGDMLRNGFTLACSLELAAQWSCCVFRMVAWADFMRLLVFFMISFLTLFIRLLSIVEMRRFGVGGLAPSSSLVTTGFGSSFSLSAV